MQPKEIFLSQIRNMMPYNPPLEGRTGGDFLLLDFNERTTSPHPLVLDAIREEVEAGRFQIYPEYGNLDEVLGNYMGVNSDQVIPTNGSDQAIDIVYRAVVDKNDKVILPSPTFAMLEQSAHVEGADIISPRYSGPDLNFPFEGVMRRIRSDIKLVVICNPNNPTGTVVPREQSEAIIKKAKDVGAAVMIDEAYHEFAPEHTVIDLLDEYDNLFVTRSFSKTMGIARLRAGCVVSQKQNIAELRKIRGPYDVNIMAAQAMKALRHPEVVEDIKAYVAEVMNVSKPILETFYDEHGVKYFPSGAGFHLLETPGLSDFLRSRDGLQILVRPRSDPPGTVRVSIGTKGDTEKYIEAFEEFLKQSK